MSRMLVQSAHFAPVKAHRSQLSLTAFNTNSVRITLAVSVVALGALYLWMMNSATAAGFELSKLEKRRVALESEYTTLQEKEVALRSLEHIASESQNMNMVAQVRPQYIDRAEHQVAVRQ